MLMAGRIRDAFAQLLRDKHTVAPAAGAGLIDPGIAEDSEHPGCERRVGAQLIGARQRTLDGDLHQIVGVLHTPRQGPSKASQSRQERDNLFAKVLNQYRHPPSCWIAKVACTLLIIMAPAALAQVTLPNVR